MKNLQKRSTKGYLAICLLIIFCSGCASSFSTISTTDPFLKTRYYEASYDRVINAATEAASKTRNWKVEDVDEDLGLITVIDSNKWRTQIIKIKVGISQTSDGHVKVDAASYTSSSLTAEDKESIKEFLESLDNLMG